jgi:hypothetical protein
MSSSHRKLLAILRTLEYILVTGKLRPGAPTTLWGLTNNQNVEKMLLKGSGKLSVMRLVLDILKKGRELQFSIEPVWVSRDNPFLQKADALSKGIDSDNWAISPADFNDLAVRFGPFTVDLFATGLNPKCNRFYTQSAEEGSCGVDAFAKRWEGERVYAAPPVSLVLRTIRKAANIILGGVLIVPLWKSANYWTFTFDDGRHLNRVFAGMQIVHMCALAWEITARDSLGGHELQFLPGAT